VRTVDRAAAAQDARRIHDCGEGRMGTDEDTIVSILAERSIAHMLVVAECYKATGTKAGSLKEALKSELGGNLGRLAGALADPAQQFADAVHSAVSGAGTDDQRLVETIRLTRQDIADAGIERYGRDHSKTLFAAVEADTSGPYRVHLLLALASTLPRAISNTCRRAMHGVGTRTTALIHALTSPGTSKLDLSHASHYYNIDWAKGEKESEHDALADAIKAEESGNCGRFLAALVESVPRARARVVGKAIGGIGTDIGAVADALASATARVVADMREQYKLMFRRDMVADLEGDTSGHAENLLVRLASGSRRPDPAQVDEQAARSIAEAIHKAGEGTWGTDDDRLVEILSSAAVSELREAARLYRELFSKPGKESSLIAALKSETSGSFEKLLVASADPIAFAARRIRKAIKGFGTDDQALIATIAIRDRWELKDIATSYNETYERDMADDITSDISGDYARAVIAWVRG
jgi:hypothetical protein